METPLSPLQQAYLLGRSDQWPLGGVAMHDFREYRGHVPDLAKLKQRLLALVKHYSALRTCIIPVRMTQYIRQEATLNFDVYDLRHLSHDEAELKLADLRDMFSHQCHDPALPLWRIAVVQLAERIDQERSYDALLLTSFDALILDGPGIATIIARLFDDRPLASITPTGADITPDATHRNADTAWWRAKLATMTTPPALPWQTALSKVKKAHFRSASLTIPRQQLKKVSRLGSAQNLLRNSVLSALILDTLAHWTTDGEICVGVPVAFPASNGELNNRSSFVAVRYSRHGADLAQRAMAFQDALLSSLDHLAFSGVDLARELSKQSQGNPSLPVIMTNCMSWETLAKDAPMRYADGLTTTPQVAIDLRLMLDEEKNLLLRIDYVEQVLAQSEIQALLTAVQRRITAVCDNDTLAIAPGQFIDYSHYKLNSSSAPYDAQPYLQQLADNLFASPSSHPALICADKSLSYRELGQQVQNIIACLQHRGVSQGDVIALFLPRIPQHIMLTLACALQGIIWVPIDVNSPPERTAYLLDNCQPTLVVHQGELNCANGITLAELEKASERAPRLATAESLRARSVSCDPAFYLYTSGTTGKPKCVVLNNRATANVISQTRQKWQVTADDVFISVTPLHHDMSMFDLFGALCSGATLVLPAANQEKDAISWNRQVERYGVTLWCSVPAILEMLLSCKTDRSLQSLRLIAQGGDYIKPATIKTLRTGHDIQLFSLGGPTETTIWSIWHAITAEDTGTIPYGQPLPGNDYFICHDDGVHCPVGVTGRIHTAGVNLAAGYLQAGALNQQDFVDIVTPDGQTMRTFRTGDEGYYRPDGNIMFASRINGYVKIRGVRVSLPETEDVLRLHSAIADVAVVDYPGEHGEVTLGALYCTHNAQPLSLAELRAHAITWLVCTHIPTRFIHVDTLPLSANGKVDRHAIRARLRGDQQMQLPACTALPADVSEAQSSRILAIYLQAIGITSQPEWGEETAFMSMGLKLPHLHEIVERINASFGSNLAVTALIGCKNVRQVATLLAS